MTEATDFSYFGGPPEYVIPESFSALSEIPDKISIFTAVRDEMSSETKIEQLTELAKQSDNGGTLLIEILAEIGVIDPLHVVAKYRSDIMLQAAQRDSLDYKQQSTSLTKAELNHLRSLNQSVDALHIKVLPLYDMDQRLSKAKSYYDFAVMHTSAAESTDPGYSLLEEIYDGTAEFDNTGVLKIISSIKDKLPKHFDFNHRRQTTQAEQKIVEAERLVRILMLEETDQISFD